MENHIKNACPFTPQDCPLEFLGCQVKVSPLFNFSRIYNSSFYTEEQRSVEYTKLQSNYDYENDKNTVLII